MSDSLNATVMVIVLVFTISANPAPEALDEEDELLELPRLPALALPVPPDPLVEEPEPELARPVLPADTESPGERLPRDTIVPLVGADREVSDSAVSAFCTLSCAL